MKPRGGISCFIQVNFLKYFRRTDISVSENIIVSLENGDVVLGSYVPPSDSPYHQITDLSKVANIFVPKDCDRVMFGGGNLNSRIVDLRIGTNSRDIRYHPDVDKVVNDSGKEILKIWSFFLMICSR